MIQIAIEELDFKIISAQLWGQENASYMHGAHWQQGIEVEQDHSHIIFPPAKDFTSTLGFVNVIAVNLINNPPRGLFQTLHPTSFKTKCHLHMLSITS